MNKENIIRMAREAGSIDSEDVIETVYEAFTAAEREACAKICDSVNSYDNPMTANDVADAIRARGQNDN